MNLFDMYRSMGMIPASYKVAMSYEEQLLWLCKQIMDVQSGTTNVEARLEALEQEMPNKQDKLTAGYEIGITDENEIYVIGETLKNYNYSYMINEGYYINNHDVEVGDTLDLTPVEAINTAYFEKEVVIGEKFRIEGSFSLTKIDKSTHEVITQYNNDVETTPYIEYEVANEEGILVVSYWNTNVYEPKIYEIPNSTYLINAINKAMISGSGSTGVKNLTANWILQDGVTPNFEEGFYYTTGSYSIIFENSGHVQTELLGNYQLFYYNEADKTIFTPAFQYFYAIDQSKWTRTINDYNTDEIVDDRFKIPTSKAVYDVGEGYKNAEKNLASATTIKVNMYDSLTQGTVFDFTGYDVGDVYTETTESSVNEASIKNLVQLGESFEIVGDFELILCEINEGKIVKQYSGSGTQVNPFILSPLNDSLKDRYYVAFINLTDTTSTYSINKNIYMHLINEINSTSNENDVPNAKNVYNEIQSIKDKFPPIDYYNEITTGYYIDFYNANVGDTISLTPVSGSNVGYFIKDVEVGDEYEIKGSVSVALIDGSNEIVVKANATSDTIPINVKVQNANEKIVISYWNTDQHSPDLRRVVTSSYITGKQNQITYSTTDLTPEISYLPTGDVYFVYE